MPDISTINQATSVLHATVTHQKSATRLKNRPEHITGNVKLVSYTGKNSQLAIRFDSTGQIVPSAKNVKKNSATADLVNLLA